MPGFELDLSNLEDQTDYNKEIDSKVNKCRDWDDEKLVKELEDQVENVIKQIDKSFQVKVCALSEVLISHEQTISEEEIQEGTTRILNTVSRGDKKDQINQLTNENLVMLYQAINRLVLEMLITEKRRYVETLRTLVKAIKVKRFTRARRRR